MAQVNSPNDNTGDGLITTTIPEEELGDQEEHSPHLSSVKGAPGSIGACDACRIRKVRCLANDSSASSRCQRCTRANRECVYTTHSKTRRRKRTDTRVKELEEKVRGLSMLLEHSPHAKAASTPSSNERDSESMERDEKSRDPTPNHISSPASSGAADGRASFGTYFDQAQADALKPYFTEWGQTNSNSKPSLPDEDVIDRGILDMAKANELFNRYQNEISVQYPAVMFDKGTTAAHLRTSKPILFLAVLAASAGESHPALNLKLNQEAQQIYARVITIQGYKSLELVQALCVSILWTYPPGKYEELKFHQQIHMATTMALDLGLGKRPRPGHDHQPFLDAPHGRIPKSEVNMYNVKKDKQAAPDSSALECRRTLLTCYIFCASVSMSLRLPIMIRFTKWMQECLEVLETSPEALPTDKRLAAWARIAHIVEECGSQFSLDDPGNTASLADVPVQVMLKGSEQQMEKWRSRAVAQGGIMTQFLEMTYHVSNVYLHEIALHQDHDSEDFRPPYYVAIRSKNQSKYSPPYINAILVCIYSSECLLNTFLSMDARSIRCLPTMSYARVVYVLVILMKLSISATASSSDLRFILDPQDRKVESFLERVSAHLDVVAQLDDQNRFVLAAQFLNIVKKLNGWYEQQKTLHGSEEGQAKQGSDLTLNPYASPRPAAAIEPGPDFRSEEPSSPSQSQSQPQNLYQYSQYAPSSMNQGGLFSNSNQQWNNFAADSADTQSLQATSWPDQSQFSGTGYPDQQSGFQSPSNIPFDFPMDLDPNTFTHLTDEELNQGDEQNWIPNGGTYEGMDYTTMPEFSWLTWPTQTQ